jgi:hypothetical protein
MVTEGHSWENRLSGIRKHRSLRRSALEAWRSVLPWSLIDWNMSFHARLQSLASSVKISGHEWFEFERERPYYRTPQRNHFLAAPNAVCNPGFHGGRMGFAVVQDWVASSG